MPPVRRYRRVLVKVSGEGLTRSGTGIDADAIGALVDELRSVTELGVQLALVVGGGNFLRGRMLADNPDIERTTADYMGMLATVMNGLALRDSLLARGLPARLFSAIPMEPVCERFDRRKVVEALEAGEVAILAGGTGSPFFTTDTCGALRAAEIGAEVMIKATKVDGVFDADPQTHPDARKYDRLTYHKVLTDRLGVMDLTAISLCMDNHLPVIVLNAFQPGNLRWAVQGEPVGTQVTEAETGA